jgi:exosortase
MRAFALPACLLIAFWPVWQWYIERYLDKSDEPLGLLAVITFVVIALVRSRSSSQPIQFKKSLWLLSCALLVTYVISWWWAPKAVHAVFALTLVGLSFASLYSMGFADWCLLYLTLPVVATVNFVFGYPMRIAVAYLSSLLLHCTGISAVVQGTTLIWNSRYVEVDPPCSGIKMLWFSLYLAVTISSWLKFKWSQTALLVSCSVVLAIVGNALRVTLLFFLENELLPITGPWAHQAIGITLFAGTVIGLGLIAKYVLRNSTLPANDVAKTTGGNSPTRTRALYAGCLLAAVVPFVPVQTHADATTLTFPGWPEQFQGVKISKLPDDEMIQEFGREFPGRIGFFTNGQERICLRWIAHETRQLHSSSDCYRGLGYAIVLKPPLRDPDGTRWSCFEAEKGRARLLVKERIFDSAGDSWDDVSGWYWSALLQRCTPPWWAVTVVKRIQ